MSEKILEIRHLSKTFGTNLVLKDIDLSVKQQGLLPVSSELPVPVSPPLSAASITWKSLHPALFPLHGTPVTKKNRLEMAKNILPWYSSSSTCIHT